MCVFKARCLGLVEMVEEMRELCACMRRGDVGAAEDEAIRLALKARSVCGSSLGERIGLEGERVYGDMEEEARAIWRMWRNEARRCVQMLLAKKMVHAAMRIADAWLCETGSADAMSDCYAYGFAVGDRAIVDAAWEAMRGDDMSSRRDANPQGHTSTELPPNPGALRAAIERLESFHRCVQGTSVDLPTTNDDDGNRTLPTASNRSYVVGIPRRAKAVELELIGDRLGAAAVYDAMGLTENADCLRALHATTTRCRSFA